MRKTRIVSCLVVCLLCMLMASTAFGAEYTLSIGHAQPVTHPRHLSLLEFEKIVEEKTGGAVEVELFSDGQLGTEAEMLESVEMGILEGMRGGQMDFVPQMLAFTLPFLAETIEDVEVLLSSDLCAEIRELAQKDNMIMLSVCDSGGFRNFSANKPLKTPDDFKGMKMRSPGIITIDWTLQALGASSTTVPYSELYLALNTGVADGQENPYINVAAMKFYEVQDYFTEVNYQFHPDPFYINLDFWNGLPAEYQAVITEAAAEMCKVNNRLITENLAAAKQEIIDGGATVIELTEEERKAFRDAVQPVYQRFVDEGYFTQEQMDKLTSILAK